jgi:hypothetical protein
MILLAVVEQRESGHIVVTSQPEEEFDQEVESYPRPRV